MSTKKPIHFSLVLIAAALTSLTAPAQISLSDSVECSPALISASVQGLGQNLSWTFSNGVQSTAQSPQVLFTTPGIYGLTVTDGTTTYTLPAAITISASPSPTIAVSADSVCPGDTVSFSSSIQNAQSYYWDFGDGTNSVAAQPAKVYQSAGIHMPTLTVTDQNGCSGFAQYSSGVEVDEAANTSFNLPDTLFCSLPLTLTLNASDSSGSNLVWNLDGTNLGTGASVQTTIQLEGTYQVELFSSAAEGCTSSTTKAFRTVDASAPDLSFIDTQSCVPLVVPTQLLNGFSNAGWSTSDTSTTWNGSEMALNAPGTHTVEVVAQDDGCSVTNAVEIEVLPLPIPNAIVNDSNLCLNEFLTLQNPDTTASSVWEVNGQLLNGPAHQLQMTSEGYQDITLYTTHLNGCADSIELNDLVMVESGAPDVDWSSMNSCVPAELHLEHMNPSLNQVTWALSSGDTFFTEQLDTTLHVPGTYDLTFMGESHHGCRDTVSHPAFINAFDLTDQISAPFTFTNCVGGTVVLDGNVLNAVEFNWDLGSFGASTDSLVTLELEQPGEFTFGFDGVTAQGCSIQLDTHTLVQVGGVNPVFSVEAISCMPPVAQFEVDTTGLSTWSWVVDDSSIAAQHFTWSAQSYAFVPVSLQVTDSFGCSNAFITPNYSVFESCLNNPAMTGNIYMPSGSSAWGLSMEEPLFVCIDQDVQFNAPLDTNWQTTWFFGNGQSALGDLVSTSYDSTGVYDITVANYRSDSNIYDTLVFSGAVVVTKPGIWTSYEVFELCDGPAMEILDGAIEDVWFTAFGDGNESGDARPGHTYDTAAYYNLYTRLEDSNGCASHVNRTIAVGNPTGYDAMPTEWCGDSLWFDHPFDGFSTYEWTFGNLLSTAELPVFSGLSTGTYLFSLSATDTAGCIISGVWSDSVTVLNPIAQFTLPTAYDGCDAFDHLINNTSLDADAFKWYVNNEFTSAGMDLSPVLQEAGTHAIKLSAHAGKCSALYEEEVTVHYPTVDFSVSLSQHCAPANLQLYDESNAAMSWTWDLGLDSSLLTQNPELILSAQTSDSIKLTVTDSLGCTASSVQVFPDLLAIEPHFESELTCLPGDLVMLTGATVPCGHHWKVDGQTFTTDTLTIPNIQEVPDTAWLTAWHSSGCSTTVVLDSMFKHLDPQVHIDFSIVSGECAPYIVAFTAETDADTWLWDFGDGHHAAELNPSHTYMEPGNFNPQLIVTNQHGCKDTAKLNEAITITGPRSGFEMSCESFCTGQTFAFNNTSRSFVKNLWIFGDGKTSQRINPKHAFEQEGNYDIALIVFDDQGCKDYSYRSTNVKETPEATILLEQKTSCIPAHFDFDWNTNDTLGAELNWVSSVEGQITSQDDTSFFLLTEGKHEVTATINFQNGCSVDTSFREVFSVLDTISHVATTLRTLAFMPNHEFAVAYEITPDPAFESASLFMQRGNAWEEVLVVEDTALSFHLPDTLAANSSVCFKLLPQVKCAAPSLDEIKPHCSLHLEAEKGDGVNHLTWQPLTNVPIEAYRLFAGSKEESLGKKLVGDFSPHTFEAVDSTLHCPGEMSYYLEAVPTVDHALEANSNRSTLVMDTAPELLQFTDIQLVSVLESEEVLVQWKASTNPKLTGYSLRRTAPNGEQLLIGPIGKEQNLYIDAETMVDQASYRYELLEGNACGLGKAHTEANSILLEFEADGEDLKLHWNQNEAWQAETKRFKLQKQNAYGEWETIETNNADVRSSEINLLEIE